MDETKSNFPLIFPSAVTQRNIITVANRQKGKDDRHLANICSSFSVIVHLRLQRQKHQAFRKLSGYKGLRNKQEAAQTESTRMKGIQRYSKKHGKDGVDNKGVNSLQRV